MAAKFVLTRGNSGKYRFNLLSTNGQVVATSEAYETKRAALAGIESVRKSAPAATLEDRGGDDGEGAAKKAAPAKKAPAAKQPAAPAKKPAKKAAKKG